MNPITKILAIVDPTTDRHMGASKAALLAERFNARLELLACETKASRELRLARHLQAAPDKPFEVNLKPMLEAIAQPLRQRGLDVTTELAFGNPLHAALIDRIKRTTADLVVKDTHHHTLAQRTLLTNTDWELIRNCPAPLLLAKPKAWAATPRVFAALDPGHVNDKPVVLDHRILEHSALVARKLGGELHVIHAYIPMTIIAAAAVSSPPMPVISIDDLEVERDLRFNQLKALVSDYGVSVAHIHLETGGPYDVLPRFAERLGADIMVMGAISRSGLQRAFIGSTAEDVLERLPCDALVVKPPNFAEMLPF
jgi:universal stress protein E